MQWWLLLAEGDPSPLAQVDDPTDWAVIALTILFFVVFLNLLRSLVLNPVFALLDQRKATISDGYAEIERQRVELAQLKADYARQLAIIDASAQEQIQAAIDEARKVAQALQEEARQQYLAALARGQADLAQELASSRERIFADVSTLAFTTADRVLGQPVDRAAHTAQVHQIIQEVIS